MGERSRNNLKHILGSKFKIALDSAVLIYYFENNPLYSFNLHQLFVKVENGQKVALISVVAIHEVLVKPKKTANNYLVQLYKIKLQSYPNLYIYPVTLEIADKAAGLRAKYSFLRAPDAFQLATAIEMKAEVFLTADKRLKQIKEIEVIILE